MNLEYSSIKYIRLVLVSITLFFTLIILSGGYYYNQKNETALIEQERLHSLTLYKQNIKDQVKLTVSEIYTRRAIAQMGAHANTPEAEKNLQKITLRHLRNIQPASTEIDQGRYTFIYDKTDRYLLHIDTDRIGKLRRNFVSSQVDQLFSFESVYAQPNHQAFFTYKHKMFNNDRREREKISFVTTIPEWRWVVGAGIYLDDVYAKTAAQERLIKKGSRKNLSFLIVGSLLFLIIMLGLIYRGSKFIFLKESQHIAEIEKIEQKRQDAEFRLNKSIHYDKMTKLSTFAYFEHNIGLIYKSVNAHSDGAMLCISIDNYRTIYGLYGYDIGEFVLVTMAERLKNLFDIHLICHYSNDQFLICYVPSELRPDYYDAVSDVKKAVNEPIELADYEILLSCTIGVKPFIYADESFDQIVRQANLVVEEARKDEGTQIGYFTHQTQEKIDRELYIVKSLPRAILSREIFVVYQPQINSKTGKISGVEALCRWIDPRLGFVPPDEFISLAEKNSLISYIGEYVFERACLDIQRFYPNGEGAITISINVSPIQMQQSGFVNKLLHIVEKSGIEPKRVIVEITENLLVDDLNKTSEILNELHDFGFKTSLDDFGTGYSSLSYLSHLPIDEVKIDREFTIDLLEKPQHQALIKAVSAIGHASNMEIVVEGVETAQQARWLAAHDCHLLQGFYFDKGLKIEQLISEYQENPYRFY